MRITVSAGALVVALAACAHTQTAANSTRAGAASMSVSTGQWTNLIDPSLSMWQGYDSDTVPTGWKVDDGMIMKTGHAEDLVSKQQYGNFELDFDWKIAKGGNSGVFYRATKEYDHIYWSGPEYQLLDDPNFPDGKNPKTSAGSDYALYGVERGIVKPYDTWNTSKIIVDGSHVEHWLNGKKVVDYELGSPDWKARVAASKFSKYPNYGLAKRGYIGIQGDHPGQLTLRNVRIRELP
ncbi:MAG TPA: DUF1080 domain-containing protein [Gemmatimonadaceae bacterium]|nr:DUF1080 domain-containing protein [Gemmatimonadaceae bacterium]